MIKAIFLDFEGVVTNNGRVLHTSLYEKIKSFIGFEEFEKRYLLASVNRITFENFFSGIPKEKVFSYLDEVDYNPTAKKTLEEIYQKTPLYLATNHIPVLFGAEIGSLKAGKYFQDIFVSHEMRLRKPDEEFFKTMLRKTGLNAKDCIFVDDAKRNLQAAKKLGFITIWMNKGVLDKRNDIEFTPDYTIKNLAELNKILEEKQEKK